jgi:hypothetical protein
MRILTVIVSLMLSVLAHGKEFLVTSAGIHSPKGGAISLELSIPNKSHLVFTVEFVLNGSGEGPDSNNPFPVAAGRWAFCFVGKDELWFYDGEGTFIRWKAARDGLESTGICDDPKIGEGAPEALKNWIGPKRTA